MFKTYFMLAKPGIIFGNIITMTAGFALASKGNFDLFLFIMTTLGLTGVVASAGIFNNYFDRSVDAQMSRTKSRALANGTISINNALIWGTLLGTCGFGILAFYTNALTVFMAFIGYFVYLVLYAFFKYRSFHGTLIGSIAGAMPPVIGYCAASNRFDLGALLLFLILVLWQMPHFFAIAIYHLKDYSTASIPVLPAARGVYATKIQMTLYTFAFILAACMLAFTGYTGYIYLVITLLLGCIWLLFCFKGFYCESDQIWAKKMFRYSLVVIMALSLAISFDTTF